MLDGKYSDARRLAARHVYSPQVRGMLLISTILLAGVFGQGAERAARENEITISFLGSARAHTSAVSMTSLKAIRVLVKIRRKQMRRPQLRLVWSSDGWSTTCGKCRQNHFDEFLSFPKSFLDQYSRYLLFSRYSTT